MPKPYRLGWIFISLIAAAIVINGARVVVIHTFWPHSGTANIIALLISVAIFYALAFVLNKYETRKRAEESASSNKEA